ncbi:MAG: DUF2242 domain-containing protein [Comamonas sp.]
MTIRPLSPSPTTTALTAAPTAAFPHPVRAWAPAAVLGGLLLALAGCASKDVDLAHEAFDDATTFTRNYSATPEAACEAARRALLSQAYIITNASSTALAARKHFQQSREQHYEIEFNITCVPDRSGTSTVFANAVQQLYALRKTNTSASVGVSVLGSLSMPIGSSDDSLVKIGSLTLTKSGLYDRFYGLLEEYLGATTQGRPEPTATPGTLDPAAGDTNPPATQSTATPAAPQSLKSSE